MSVVIPTIEDVVSIARREALNSGGSILGVTASEPRYVGIGEDENIVNEFVVDVFLIEDASQVVVLGSANNGLRRIDNILIASEASGNLLSNLNTPVEIMLRGPNQLTVVGRAKIAIPTVALDEYDLLDLKTHHTAELTYSDGIWKDPFGMIVDINSGLIPETDGFKISFSSTTTTRLSTLGDLIYTDPGEPGRTTPGGTIVDLGVNRLQRDITVVSMSVVADYEEQIGVEEEIA